MTAKITECQCGRVTLHCPYCGCATVAGLSSLKRIVDGADVYSYRCRKCGKVFDDLVRQMCQAPDIHAARYKKLATKVPTGPLPNWLKEMAQKRGIKIKEPSVADEIDSKLEEKETES
jgi:hypothetical protein